jgi:cyclophilin family peptidyl-prolyl cis-trans isomerase
VREAAAYALGRCAAPSAEQVAGEERARLVELLLPLLSTSDLELGRLAYKALAGLGEVPGDVDPQILGASTTLPWLVEVEAVQALIGHADGRKVVSERLAGLPATAVDDTRVHVVLAAVRGLRDAVAGNSELLARLRTFAATVDAARKTAAGRDAKRLALVGCELAIATATADGQLERVDHCADGVDGLPAWYGRALGVEALLVAGAAVPKAEKLAALLARAEDAAPQVAARALSGLADVDDDRVSAVLRRALAKDDVGVVAAAASAIAARAVDASRRDPEAAGPLALAVKRLDGQQVVEARLGAIEALGSLARSATKADEVDAANARLADVVLPLAADDNASVRRTAREALLGKPELLAKFDASGSHGGSAPQQVVAAYDGGKGTSVKGVRLKTVAGEIVIEFDGAPAPIMQAVLRKLVSDGFYDGLTVHRVVPGFVVQGGDPHGDGYGGPGFLVPCERSTLRYERGTVGIALAGKDTGGSQFFVTQTRQPHLDARYTVVGRVTEGMDVVDRLLPHDAIEDASVIP